MVEGLNKATFNRTLFADITRSNNQLSEYARQISSGNKHETYTTLAEQGDVERVISLQARVTEITTFKRSNDRVISRTDTAGQAVDQMIDIAERFSVLLAKRRGPSGDELPFQTEVQGFLEETQRALNTRFEGLYLFAGSKIDTQPVADTVTLNENLGAGTETTANYYQGDDVILTVQATETQTLSYGVTANNVAFQDLIGALHQGLNADQSDDATDFENATTILNRALDGLTTVNANLKNNTVRLTNLNEVHDASILLVQENLVNLTETDIVEASARLREIESQIEASFYAFSILNNLTLTDFLR